jgi:hypothetical protein
MQAVSQIRNEKYLPQPYDVQPSESLTDRNISLEAQRDNLRILLFDPEVPEHLKENIRLAQELAEAELNRRAESGSES